MHHSGAAAGSCARRLHARSKPVNLLLDPSIAAEIQRAAPGWRRIASAAAAAGIPVPALSGSLAYFDSYRTPRLPQHLTQAQRDPFGAHTFQRVEKPGFMHFDWGVDSQ